MANTAIFAWLGFGCFILILLYLVYEMYEKDDEWF